MLPALSRVLWHTWHKFLPFALASVYENKVVRFVNDLKKKRLFDDPDIEPLIQDHDAHYSHPHA